MNINFYDIMEDAYKPQPSADSYLYIKKVFNYLRVLGLVNSAGEFSSIYLHRSRDYYARLKCDQSLPSLGAMNNLLDMFESKSLDYASKPDKQNHYRHLCNLLKEGRFLQMKQVGLC